MSARPQQRTSWFHAPTGFWCAQIDGKRRYLDRDLEAAQRKLKKLLQDKRRGSMAEKSRLRRLPAVLKRGQEFIRLDYSLLRTLRRSTMGLEALTF